MSSGGGKVLFRRSPSVVAYWADDQLQFHNFATGAVVRGTALTIALLDYFSTWQSAEELIGQSSQPPDELRRAVSDLHEGSFLHRSDGPVSASESGMRAWHTWNPAAGFFHFSTKDVAFVEDLEQADEWLATRAEDFPAPPLLKPLRSKGAIRLSRARVPGSLADALRRRRTWRRFGHSAVSKTRLGALLDLTFGARYWLDLGAAGRSFLRTSPSAGARNPLEAYVAIRRVPGIRPGVYAYAVADHRLVPINRQLRPLSDYFPGQAWYAGADAVVLMTAVVARTEWKYPFARAYRTLLLEAGHFAQTFCLVATALELAPFCTAALADSLIEHDLRVDGVSETLVYACGVGSRPSGVSWAPWPNAADAPTRQPVRPRRSKSDRRTSSSWRERRRRFGTGEKT
ncbi:MAG: SagB family peptide dehydrogenase [Acidobacteriota bacterium]